MSGSVMIEIICSLLVISGTAMSLLSSLGIIRLPDVYTRSHAATKTATLGILSILMATFIYFIFEHGVISIRLLLGIVFVFLTAPVAGHMITRSAHRSGVELSASSVNDDLRADLEQYEREHSIEARETRETSVLAENTQASILNNGQELLPGKSGE